MLDAETDEYPEMLLITIDEKKAKKKLKKYIDILRYDSYNRTYNIEYARLEALGFDLDMLDPGDCTELLEFEGTTMPEEISTLNGQIDENQDHFTYDYNEPFINGIIRADEEE